MKKILFYVTFISGLFAGFIDTGNELYYIMQKAKTFDDDRARQTYKFEAMAFIDGWSSGYLGFYNTLKALERKKAVGEICNDKLEKLTVQFPQNHTHQQLYDIVYKYLDENPEKRHLDLDALMVLIFKEAFGYIDK